MLDIFNPITNQEQHEDGSYLINLGESSYPASRKLKDVVSQLLPGRIVEWVSNGDWSQHELLLALLELTGPATVYISSYAFSERPARIIADLVNDGIIKSLYCLIDSRVDTRSASALTLVQNCATKCKLVDTHAKVTVIITEGRQISVIGSANYTTNHRYEAGMIIEREDSALFHQQWIMEALNGVE
jgi:hypothetical protein